MPREYVESYKLCLLCVCVCVCVCYDWGCVLMEVFLVDDSKVP